MRAISGYRARLATAALGATLAAVLTGCSDDQCNHVITGVPTFEECQAIAVERGCSNEVTYARANDNRPARCKVEDCSDCDGAAPTPTAAPEP